MVNSKACARAATNLNHVLISNTQKPIICQVILFKQMVPEYSVH